MDEKQGFDELIEAANQQIDSQVEDVLVEGHDPDLQADLDSQKIWSPWSEEVVKQLNLFQEMGNFHPFTCPNKHDQATSPDGQVPLIADVHGWICRVKECDYQQDWAWQAMADPRNILTLSTMPVQINGAVFEHSNPRPRGCTCVIEQTSSGWKIELWNRTCTLHAQLEGSSLDTDAQGRHRDISKEELDAAAFPARNDEAGLAKLKTMAKSANNVVGVIPGVRELNATDLGIEVPADGLVEIEVPITLAGLQQLEVEDLFNIFTDARLRELFGNFTAEQQLEIQEYWRFEEKMKEGVPPKTGKFLTAEEIDNLPEETAEEIEAAFQAGQPVDVEVDLVRPNTEEHE